MADERNAKLILGVETKGTDKADKALQGLVKSTKSLEAELKSASKSAGGLDIKSEVGGGNAPAAAKFRGAASLLGGGELVGLIDDFQDLGEGLVQLKSAAPGVVDGVVKLVASLGPAGIGLAAVVAVAAIAVAHLAAEQKKAADALRAQLEAERSLREKINAGATTEDLKKELAETQEARAREVESLKTNQAAFDAQNASTETFSTNILSATGNLTALTETEKVRASDLKKQKDDIAAMEASELKLTEAIKNNVAATNDMEAEEKKLAAARTQAVLDTATAAGNEVAAKRRADDASYESNLARIESIDDERAAIEAQIEVLKSSGDTSEAVTGQIEKLTSQLGALGGEADYIKSTALEASKRRDEEKKAAKQAEENAKKAADAQQKYAEGIKNANLALKQATADINTKLKQGLADNLEGMFRDVTDIATQYRRDTFDMDLKANQAERDALTEHYRDIDDIRDDALKSEQEALRDGDFKAAFLAKQAGADALKQEQKETLRERSDRTRALGDERDDLKRSSEQARSDRMLALERQNADTRTAAQRELQQATLTRTRALEMNAASYKSELAALGSFLQQRNQLLNQANQAALANIGGRGGASGLNNTGRAIQQQMAAAVGGIIRR